MEIFTEGDIERASRELRSPTNLPFHIGLRALYKNFFHNNEIAGLECDMITDKIFLLTHSFPA